MTNDGMLSQDEIDALLNVTNDDENEEKQADETIPDEETSQTEASELEDVAAESAYLTDLEIDALGEIGNISFGSSATTLSTILNQKVDITTPTVSIVKKTGIKEEFPYEHVSLQVDYTEGFDGENIFLMKANDVAIISDIMLGGTGENPSQELSEIELSAVQEAMNQMMGASATSMSTVFDKKIDISPPLVAYEDIDKLEEVTAETKSEVFVKVSFQIKIGDLIDSNIMQLIPLEFAKSLVEQLMAPAETEVEEASRKKEAALAVQEPVQTQQEESVERAIEMERTNERSRLAVEQQQETVATQAPVTNTAPQHLGESMSPDADVQTAAFSSFEPMTLAPEQNRNLDMLLDIPLRVTVELGRTKQTVEDILELTQGSIIELDKLAGEPVDVLVNNKLIAKGEVVVIDENFGVRITDIISQKDRLEKLN